MCISPVGEVANLSIYILLQKLRASLIIGDTLEFI